jgi:hypothetical protein
MRMGRPKVELILTDDERERLQSLAHRSRPAPQLARRARIILACAEGTDSNVVARCYLALGTSDVARITTDHDSAAGRHVSIACRRIA